MAWAYPLAIAFVAGGILWFLLRVVGEVVKAVQAGGLPLT
jgi:hypothetical protein